MSIWKKPVTLDAIHQGNANTAVSHLGIEITEIGDDYLVGRVPVDKRTVQPFGLLHGGVSVVLAETLGSIGAYYASPEGHAAVGLDINATHLRAAAGSRPRPNPCILAVPPRSGRSTCATTMASRPALRASPWRYSRRAEHIFLTLAPLTDAPELRGSEEGPQNIATPRSLTVV